MTQEQALRAVRAYLREQFGQALVPRECRRVRRVAGVNWLVRVVVPATGGDVMVADLDVDEGGQITPRLTIDDMVVAVRRSESPSSRPKQSTASNEDPLAGLHDSASFGNGTDGMDSFISGFDDVASGDAPPDDPDEIRRQVQELLGAGNEPSLLSARALMPRLLQDAERRGITLVWMAEIERRLRDRTQALQFLEAAAREFADRFDMAALEKCAAMAGTLMSREQMAGTTLHRLLESSRVRMRPLTSMWEASALGAIRPEEREWLAAHAPLRTLSPNEVLLQEGEPSRNVFIIKSGLLAILIDVGEVTLQRVRYCCPGWLLGESSVLQSGATATATLRAHGPTEVYCIAAEALKLVLAQNPALRRRIAATKHMHRLDSFFTTHELLGTLDVQVRDEVIECVQRIDSFEEETTLLLRGEPPPSALLVAKGEVALYDTATYDPLSPPSAAPVSIVGADSFYGVRDALHEAPSALTAVARPGTTVTFFDAERLRTIAARIPGAATAALERLG